MKDRTGNLQRWVVQSKDIFYLFQGIFSFFDKNQSSDAVGNTNILMKNIECVLSC